MMKAKVKATGKVIILNENVSLIEYARGMYRDTEGNKYHCKELEFIKEKVEKPIDWEQRRYEIAKVMLSAVFESKDSYGYRITLKEAATEAVSYADALIEELKKTM